MGLSIGSLNFWTPFFAHLAAKRSKKRHFSQNAHLSASKFFFSKFSKIFAKNHKNPYRDLWALNFFKKYVFFQKFTKICVNKGIISNIYGFFRRFVPLKYNSEAPKWTIFGPFLDQFHPSKYEFTKIF